MDEAAGCRGSLRRIFVPPEHVEEGTVRLVGEAWRHARGVLRLGVGDRFEALSGDGRGRVAVLRRAGRREAVAEVEAVRDLPLPPEPHLHLLLAMPRRAAFEAVVEKAVELGAARVVAVRTEHSAQRRAKAKDGQGGREARWGRIVQAATRQSTRGDLMEVAPPVPLARAVEEVLALPRAAGLFAWEGGGEPLLPVLQRLAAGRPRHVALVVGSEGGLSAGEAAFLRERGFPAATMGPQVLRVETAAVALLAAASLALGRMA